MSLDFENSDRPNTAILTWFPCCCGHVVAIVLLGQVIDSMKRSQENAHWVNRLYLDNSDRIALCITKNVH